MASLPRKAWSELSPSYQSRMKKHGLNGRNWSSKKGAELRKAARGHARTPERPTQAERNPAKYPEYVSRRGDEQRQLEARKQVLFGDRIKYRRGRSISAATINPRTKIRPRTDYVRRFLRMSSADVENVDWSDDEWGFLFYH